MIQDIFPSRLKNEYRNYEMRDEDFLLFFNKDGKILLGRKEGKAIFPTGLVFKKFENQSIAVIETEKNGAEISDGRIVYLFSIDDKRFFLMLKDSNSDSEDDKSFVEDSLINSEGYAYYTVREVRDQFTGKEVYAVFTAYHLWRWYSDNLFCGRCGTKLELSDKERALRCPECGNIIYPRINPAVIVGVIKDDSLLITKYRTGYQHNALVAGFTEIGETLEETVAREVMEETGVRVKNIRYYKSQPWGMAQDMLVGFFCEADGDGEIHMDKDELKYAEWVKKEDIVLQPNNFSLTNEMMKVFKGIVIETERLYLRKMNMNDFDSLYAVLADSEIMKHYPYNFDEGRVRDWIERNMKRYENDGFGLWAVCLKDTGEMIGDCGLTLQNIDGIMLPEIGYHIRRDCQRKGYARETAAAVRDWAFQNTSYPALYSYCKYTNEPSYKTAQSIGMHFEKEYPDEANEITHVSVIRREDIIRGI